METSLKTTVQAGREGEEAAVRFLENKGFDILDRNWHGGHKELDIIAIHDGYLVVAEVKTRGENPLVEPSEAVTPVKIRRIVSAANRYLVKYSVDLPVRFDVLSVTASGDRFTIEHIEDAFEAPLN